MNPNLRNIGCILLLAAAVGIVGCGSTDNSPPSGNISGTVKIDGQPLENGMLVLENVSQGLYCGLEVTNGSFSGACPVGELTGKVVQTQPRKIEDGGPPREIVETTDLKTGIQVSVKAGNNAPLDIAIP